MENKYDTYTHQPTTTPDVGLKHSDYGALNRLVSLQTRLSNLR